MLTCAGEGFWLAAVLAVGGRAALSHRDAAALHDLRPCNRPRIETTVSRTLVDLAEVVAADALRKALNEADSIPRPHMNLHVEGYEGDAVWPAARLVVELDGWDAHKTRRAFQRDRTKANALTNAGWTVLRFTHADVVGRPRETAAAIATQLSRAA